MEKIRLNKYLSAQGVCSRRKADDWTEAGKSLINGRPAVPGETVDVLVTEWGIAVNPRRSELKSRLQAAGYDPEALPCVSTGYGRVSVPYAGKTVTEITCHAKGAMLLHRSRDLTVVDIGGQDTKIIRVEGGLVKDFIMNDKCSAGTGRFLEVMANTLGLRPDDMCELARQGGGVSISSMCTVFAESEVISLIGKGEKKENIAFAVVDSIVKKVASQAKRLEEGGLVCLTGGLCESDYIRLALGRQLRTEVVSVPEGRYAGAVGAALCAAELAKKG